MDPDPHSFSLLDPDSGGKNNHNKKLKEIGNTCNFMKIVKVNLDQLHGFILEQYYSFFQLQKTLRMVIFLHFYKAVSGST